MGVRFATVFSTTLANALPATNAETVILTAGPINLAVDNAPVFLFWSANITPGTSVTAHSFLLRRGTTTVGTSVAPGSWVTPTTATVTISSSGWYVDSPGVAAALFYSLTLVQTAATAAGVAGNLSLLAMVL